ncbi:hypothetical protein MAPG_00497, partial [Magnaporthiopsis poae ATCC 64411]
MDDHWIAQPNPAPVGIEVDPSRAFQEVSELSSTVSLSSSVLRELEENGRKYHGYKDGKYVLPMDETFDNKLNFAPVETAQRVLDAGCGLGFWAIDFGERVAPGYGESASYVAYPVSTATRSGETSTSRGRESSKTQQSTTVVKNRFSWRPRAAIGVLTKNRGHSSTPPNAIFEIDDLEEAWTFSFKFDYIHASMMTGAFRDWPRFIRQSYEFLAPGGYLELQDIDFPVRCDDDSLPADSALKQWS